MSGRTRLRIAAFLIFCASATALGQTVGTLTVVEGGLQLVRGSTTYTAAQGVALQNGDMLAPGPKGQVQIEFEDGAILNLTRGSRAWLLGPQGAGREIWVALQPGWAKFTWTKAAKGRPYRYIMPLASLSAARATGVLRIGEGSSEAFIESGAARLVELSRAGSPAGGRDVKGGEFAVRSAAQGLAVSPRPSAEFIKAMPGYFRDDLPVFISRARAGKMEPAREHDATYAEVEPWLKAPIPIRRNLVERFRSRAKDPQFRGKLIENLAAHPEWDRVLFPEKHEGGAEKAEKAQTR
jgi:hypothetical protein